MIEYKLDRVTLGTQTREGRVIATWWMATLPNGTLFMISSALPEAEAQSAYEDAAKKMLQ